MYRTRKLRFKHGRFLPNGTRVRKTNDPSVFTNYIMDVCREANKTTKTQFVSVRVDESDNWTFKIKTKNKDYFNIISQNFVRRFRDVLSEIKF